VINYIPKGKALKAMQYLDSEGAQYGTELSAHVDCLRTDLKRTLETALRHELVGCEFRIRKGAKSHMLWFLTPKGCDLLAQIQWAEEMPA
jgi:hypothetical protein